MADFRLVRRLHAYSGGTVPDFDRISYSPSILPGTDGTQATMNLCHDYTPKSSPCQERFCQAEALLIIHKALKIPLRVLQRTRNMSAHFQALSSFFAQAA